jgi:hypothetical protein
MANVYLTGVWSKGYKTATATAHFQHEIPGSADGRLIVFAFGLTASGSSVPADIVYFMAVLGRTTVSTPALSGATSIVLTADPGPATNLLATSDALVVKLDSGVYQFLSMTGWVVTTLTVTCAALAGTVAAGQTVWDMGIYSDTGHYAYKLAAASIQYTKEAAQGLFPALAFGDPMIVYHPNAGTAIGSIDYISGGYINV